LAPVGIRGAVPRMLSKQGLGVTSENENDRREQEESRAETGHVKTPLHEVVGKPEG